MLRSTVVDNDGSQQYPQIAARLNEALARFGVAGQIRVEAGRAMLAGPGAIATADIGQLAMTWEQLSADARQQACLDVVRRLVAQRRAAAPADLGPASGASLQRAALLIALIVLLVGGTAVYRYQWSRPPQGPPPTPSRQLRGRARDALPEQAALAQDDRAARVCAQTTARVSRGATVGPTDVEGWVVELILLLRSDSDLGRLRELDQDPRLAAFVSRPAGAKAGRFVWTGARELTRLEGPNTRVQVSSTTLGPPSAANTHLAPASGTASNSLGVPIQSPGSSYQGLRLTFLGRYVAAYFTPDQRSAFVRVGHALADSLKPSYGALFARCAAGRTHYLGAWFHGPNPAGSATALVYFMGVHAAVPHLQPALLSADPGGQIDLAYALRQIQDRTRGLDKRRIATLIGTHDGMIAGAETGPSSISFPFRDGNRATRASHQIARLVGLASPH